MKRFVFLMGALAVFGAVFAAGPVFAQEDDGTIAASRPLHEPYRTPKSVREMSAEERQEFWNNLPEADKQRILERRKKAKIKELRKKPWRELSAEEKAMRMNREGPFNATDNPEPAEKSHLNE